MSRNTKIVLGLIVGVLAVCCLAAVALVVAVPRLAPRFIEGAFIEEPAEAARVGQSIADYELPPGYQEEMAMNILGTRIVLITSGNQSGMVIMLMQLPAGTQSSPEQMEAQMEDAFAQQFGSQNVDMETVDTETVTINGQPTSLTISEGPDENGEPFRRATAVFQAEEGMAMLMIIGPVADWDETAIEQFINSME